MITFKHDISAPFLQETLPKQTSLPLLSVSHQLEPIVPLRTALIYDQNQGREVILSTNLSFKNNIQDQKWVFTVTDIVSFFWEKGSKVLYYHEEAEGNATLSRYWFLHTLLPVFFTIEGKFELIHAGSVEINNKPVLFIAPSYGGKSTLTDYFLKKGHVMVSDDRVGLIHDTKIKVISSYPYHRPYRKMEDLGIHVKNFMTEVKDLHLIYVLQSVSEEDTISFERLKGIDTFKALQYNFDFNLPLNKARSFELISKIASDIEIYLLSIPWSLERLEDVYQAVCDHSNQRSITSC